MAVMKAGGRRSQYPCPANWVKLVQLHHRIITSLSPSRAIQSKPESLSILLRSGRIKNRVIHLHLHHSNLMVTSASFCTTTSLFNVHVMLHCSQTSSITDRRKDHLVTHEAQYDPLIPLDR